MLQWQTDPGLKKRVVAIIRKCRLKYIRQTRLFCYRSSGSKTRAVARIWGLPRIWQKVLKTEPVYILEIVEEKFSKLSRKEQDRVLIHELLHIPKNFSGALLSHKRKGGVNENKVKELYKIMKSLDS